MIGSESNLGVVVVGVLLFLGAFLAIWLVAKAVNNPGGADHSLAKNTSMTLEVTSDFTAGEVAEKLKSAGVTETTVNQNGTMITGKLGATWRSWGQRVEVDLTGAAPRVETEIRVWPTVGLQKIDWGAGKHALIQLRNALAPVSGDGSTALSD